MSDIYDVYKKADNHCLFEGLFGVIAMLGGKEFPEDEQFTDEDS